MLDSAQTGIKQRLREWRIIGTPPFYGLGAVFLLGLLLGVISVLVVRVHESQFPWSFRAYWYYDPVVSFSLVTLLIVCQRSSLLRLSRWRPKWLDVFAGMAVGILLPLILWPVVPDSGHSVKFLPRTSLVPIVFLSPILEELFFRATVQRSFEGYFPKAPAIILAASLAA